MPLMTASMLMGTAHHNVTNGAYRAAPEGRSNTLCVQCQVQMSRRVGVAGVHDAFLTA
jgi:hypothetical protein